MTSLTTNIANHRVRPSSIALPPPAIEMSQDREWCVVEVDGEWRKIRFHDYDEIYAIPGLYETIFYDVLRCASPSKIREMLERCTHEAKVTPGDLRALDLGAGNGMVGEELAQMGVRRIVGADIIREAAEAAHRDREDVYEEYFVLDMTELGDRHRARLAAYRFNCLTCVAALGFADIPPVAFINAYNLVEDGGWIAFNIKSDFLQADRANGFAGLIRRLIDNRLLNVRMRQQYQHRLATNGDPLPYVGIVGVKRGDVPADWT